MLVNKDTLHIDQNHSFPINLQKSRARIWVQSLALINSEAMMQVITLLLSMMFVLTPSLTSPEQATKHYNRSKLTHEKILHICERNDGQQEQNILENLQTNIDYSDRFELKSLLEELQLQITQTKKALCYCERVELLPLGQSTGTVIFKTGGFEKTFHEAMSICTQAGGQIALPRNREENEVVRRIVNVLGKVAFLSIDDIQTDPMTYTNWKPNTLSNSESSKEYGNDCLEMSLTGNWSKISCDVKRLVICKFELPKLD
ncbi:pulmonary surfactant-associated protein D-like [Erinaceus europaeus]|uniref:Pulmonary surfactant-associated protein D-like n=1 Tax=Erinaceus europaeus TaxID=9365 RepID=A0ABM3XIH4_ERIEU|nr:pulmonary surfactant-associated protein D-like [Erinaceus europaeus]